MAEGALAPDGPPVVGYRSDGLGTRLANLLWTWRLGRALGTRSIIFWAPAPAVLAGTLGSSAGCGDLFDPARLALDPALADLRLVEAPLPRLPWRHINADRSWRRQASALSRDALTAPGDPVLYSHYSPLLLAGETVDARAQARALFAALPLNPQVAAALAVLDGLDFVAVHVRRGDIETAVTDALDRWLADGTEEEQLASQLEYYTRKTVPLRALFAAVEARAPQSRLVVLSDGEVGEAFRQRFGKRVLPIGHLLRKHALLPAQKTLVDLVLMSRARLIVAPISGFSSAAALIGDVPLVHAIGEARASDYLDELDTFAAAGPLDPDRRAGLAALLGRTVTFRRQPAAFHAT